MKEVRKIYKKDIPSLIEDSSFWDHSFLCISKHRLWAHYRNPRCTDEDIVMLLAYWHDELVGYMGVYTDFITIDGHEKKIGWLSTWWVHPKTKGSGIGRMLLQTMYDSWEGRIGISQFTESAKRVYDRSGYFVDLKNNEGIKAVLRSNLGFLIPVLLPKTKPLKAVFEGVDAFLNVAVAMRLWCSQKRIRRHLFGFELDYLPFPDKECSILIERFGEKDLSHKDQQFFEWLQSYSWVYTAPLKEMTNCDKYAFSMYDHFFQHYFVKLKKDGECIGFMVLQHRATTLKVLFAYFDDARYGNDIADVIKLHAIRLRIREIICYEPAVVEALFKSRIFLYKRKKMKQSIISKAFGVTDFDGIRMNFGDGDCSFA